MSKKKTNAYCQCRLVKLVKRGEPPFDKERDGPIHVRPRIDEFKELVTWIAAEKVQGNLYKFAPVKARAGGDWEDGWQIVQISEPKPAARIEAQERDYLLQRKASDI